MNDLYHFSGTLEDSKGTLAVGINRTGRPGEVSCTNDSLRAFPVTRASSAQCSLFGDNVTAASSQSTKMIH